MHIALLTIALAAALAPAASAAPTAPLTVDVAEWAELWHEPDQEGLDADIVMDPVADGDWGTQNQKIGACFVFARANFRSRLKVPVEVTLSEPGSGATLPAKAVVTLIGQNVGGSTGGGYSYYDLNQPGRKYSFTLTATIAPDEHGFVWGGATHSGTYHGLIVMELLHQP